MTQIKSIWDKFKKKEVKEKTELQKELSDEIKLFRQKNKEFQATNDHETYLIVVFSTKEDKNEFLQNVQLKNENTLIDGYKLAKILNLAPIKPKYKLKNPF